MIFKKMVVTASVLFLAPIANAGSVSGGGGKGVVCREERGAIRSVELLDLWEAKIVYGRKILSSREPTETQVEAALDRIKFALANNGLAVSDNSSQKGATGAEALRTILKFDTDRLQKRNLPQIHWLKGVRLKLSDDSFESVIPSDCEIEQVVRYQDTSNGGEIYINQELYDSMDETNQAALLVHEAFYAYLRQAGEKSSLRVRRTIGLTFSNHRFLPLEDRLPNDFYVCLNEQNSVLFYRSNEPSGRDNIVSQILMADGRHGIDFDAATVGWEFKNYDDFFNSRHVSEYTNLGESTSIDYSVNWKVNAGFAGKKELKIQFASSPDQEEPSPEVTLPCALVKKSDFFKH